MQSRKNKTLRTAFVIMPIKAKNASDYDTYQNIYTESIKPLLEEMGYSVLKAGDAKHSISVNKELALNLLKADLVIADLTSLNPNTYYRLDIRFKINGSPTILLLNEDKGISSQFDSSNYPTIAYHTSRDGQKSLVTNLLKLISEFNYPYYKIDSEDLEPSEKISKAIIDVHRNLVPDYIIQEAEKAVSDKDLRKFIECVQNFTTLDSFKPTDRDYALFYDLSDKIKEGSTVSKAILDLGLEAFPESERLFNLHIVYLSTSSRQSERNLAKKHVRDKLKIEITNNEAQVHDVNTLGDIDLISWMLDAYHFDGEHNGALGITSSLMKKFDDNAVVLRNHARALEKTKKESIATILALYQRAMFCLSVDVTTARWYAATLFEQKRLVDATEVLLFSCLLGLDDPENFSRLANVVSNLLQPSNPILVRKMVRPIPNILNNTVVLEAIILSESCEEFSAKQRFLNEKSLRNIGIPKEQLNNYYLDKYKGGDVSRPDRNNFISELYENIKTDITSEEIFIKNNKIPKLKKKK